MILSSQIEKEYKNIKALIPKDFGIRKKLDIFMSSNEETQTIILQITQKSRFLQKDVEKIEEIYQKVHDILKNEFQEKCIIIKSPLCSKAKKLLEEKNWKVYV